MASEERALVRPAAGEAPSLAVVVGRLMTDIGERGFEAIQSSIRSVWRPKRRGISRRRQWARQYLRALQMLEEEARETLTSAVSTIQEMVPAMLPSASTSVEFSSTGIQFAGGHLLGLALFIRFDAAYPGGAVERVCIGVEVPRRQLEWIPDELDEADAMILDEEEASDDASDASSSPSIVSAVMSVSAPISSVMVPSSSAAKPSDERIQQLERQLMELQEQMMVLLAGQSASSASLPLPSSSSATLTEIPEAPAVVDAPVFAPAPPPPPPPPPPPMPTAVSESTKQPTVQAPALVRSTSSSVSSASAPLMPLSAIPEAGRRLRKTRRLSSGGTLLLDERRAPTNSGDIIGEALRRKFARVNETTEAFDSSDSENAWG